MTIEAPIPQSAELAPEHTFLKAHQVIARYGWGRTKGYRMLRSEGFPIPIGGDRYRLDTLMDWERRQQPGAAAKPVPTVPPRKRRTAAARSSVAVESLAHFR
jgi:hypothetical protein